MCKKEYPKSVDDIGERLRELCDRHDMTKYRLSVITGISQTALKDIETKKSIPNFSTLARICEAFGISLAQFFAGEGTNIDLTKEQKELVETWQALDVDDRELLIRIVRCFRQDSVL
ncbi:MAG: helix-turn-helix domain-containing protein [Clostridiales bacterium]|nr:helix-turn-helix domain-containing protein [Clostridiales bacterium]